MNKPDRQVIHAAGLARPGLPPMAPAYVELNGDTLSSVSRSAIDTARVEECSNLLLLPGLVNAHSHLDLTHLGPRPLEGGFVEWIKAVRDARCPANAAADSVRTGVRLLRAGGTAIVGDIANSGAQLSMPGVSYREFFGLGHRQPQTIEAMSTWLHEPPAGAGVRHGLQPHAPYSCGPDVYAWAASQSVLLSTHLAETLEELEFVRNARGPLADMLRSFGVWDDAIHPTGQHPIDALAGSLSRGSWTIAHANYIEDRHIAMLSSWPVSIAYCPRASAYFGHPHDDWPAHRYRELLTAGVNVALGTDSIICLDTPDRISILDEMRLLFQRDHTPASTLLQMATVNGARALGFDPQLVSLQPGRTLGIIGIPIDKPDAPAESLMEQALTTDATPRWVAGPFDAQVFP